MARLIPVLLAACLAGCAVDPARDVLERETQVLEPGMLQRILRRAPVATDEDLRAEPLLESDEFSAYLLQFRTGEPRHIHREHDLTLIVHRGFGTITLHQNQLDRARPVQPGDVFHIPRGTPHACASRDGTPLILIQIFTPPLEAADATRAPREERSYERAGW